MPTDENFLFINTEDPTFKERLELVKLLIPKIIPRVPNEIIGVEDDLFSLWTQAISEFCNDHERRYAYLNIDLAMENQNAWEDEIEEIRKAAGYIPNWIEKADKRFNELIKNVYIPVATDEEQLKHFPNSKWNTEKIISISNKRALISKQITHNDLDCMYCDIISQDFNNYIHSKYNEYLYETNRETGYSYGLNCNHLIFKISYSGMLAHCFPINNTEADFFKKRMTVIKSTI